MNDINRQDLNRAIIILKSLARAYNKKNTIVFSLISIAIKALEKAEKCIDSHQTKGG